MDGRSRPYFCGVDQNLNFQQKEALAQGIQQVVETTPPDFEFFEFQFTGHQIYIYKLEHGIILLVLTNSSIVNSDYAQAIEQLKLELQEDITNAIATFRLLAGNITLSHQNYWKRANDSSSSPPEGVVPPSEIFPQTASSANGSDTPSAPPSPLSPSSPLPATAAQDAADLSHLKDLLTALNELSQFTTQFLGNTMVTNAWKSTRPAQDWLHNFQVDRSAKISWSGPTTTLGWQSVTSEQLAWLQTWVEAFIKRCSSVIRDLPRLVTQRPLNEVQKTLLSRLL